MPQTAVTPKHGEGQQWRRDTGGCGRKTAPVLTSDPKPASTPHAMPKGATEMGTLETIKRRERKKPQADWASPEGPAGHCGRAALEEADVTARLSVLSELSSHHPGSLGL